MRYLVMVIVALAALIGLQPAKPRHTASVADNACYSCHYIQAGLVNAYNEYLANREAYGRVPCLRTTGAPCPDPRIRPPCPRP